ncbi:MULTISPECIES: hypothetical protein [Sphingobacterium]|jgi:hypothetical protein|uniref:Uncharacterized protein n=2 Tax=Sphingobacterium TaxID=28453 RepID=A0A654DIB7_SPHMU|nr:MULTISPECIES: hypothetical protein [Sphingobacterium]HAE67991.1 hypothetical protein [Sphingobacterium sp.]OFV17044.1 hypothetical protein HMPREF3127_09250 [Sphingobacterium sp. HMSC13C05]QQT45842.1 hypothetical protein I6J00_03975 [Sphingobacterium multivorum]QQT61516.1 hypothetical protein I6I97_20320 [Sphingobacterium multivorum]SUJ28850.1 Uncharacterised protein [Sphingobacterium multivorum]
MAEISIRIAIEKDSLIIPFTDQELLPFVDKHQKEINDYVIDQLEDKDGGPHLSDFSVNRLTFFADQTGGSFRLHFKIDRQFCCSDLLSCQTDYIDFKFNKSNNTITLTGGYISWTTQ